MKKRLLSLFILCSSILGVASASAPLLSANGLAYGGIGNALPSKLASIYQNPALLPFSGSLISIGGNIGIGLTAPKDFFGNVTYLAENGTKLQESITNNLFGKYQISYDNLISTLDNVSKLNDRLKDLGNQNVTLNNTNDLFATFPAGIGAYYIQKNYITGYISNSAANAFASLYDKLKEIKYIYDTTHPNIPPGPNGFQLPKPPVIIPPDLLGSKDLLDTTTIKYVQTVSNKLGVSYGYAFNLGVGKLSVGASPNITMLTVYTSNVNLSFADIKTISDLFNIKKDQHNYTFFNIDSGVAFQLNSITIPGKLYTGLSVKNIFNNNVTFNGVTFYKEPNITLGVGYEFLGLNTGVDLDLNTQKTPTIRINDKTYKMGYDTQNLRLGVGYSLFGWELGVGSTYNLTNSSDPLLFTGGVGFSLLIVHLNLSGAYSSREWASSVGMKFEF